jgi:hypothetical protein
MSFNGYLDPTVHDDRVATLDSSQMLELIKFGASRSVEWLFGIVERAPVSKLYIMQIHASGYTAREIWRRLEGILIRV